MCEQELGNFQLNANLINYSCMSPTMNA